MPNPGGFLLRVEEGRWREDHTNMKLVRLTVLALTFVLTAQFAAAQNELDGTWEGGCDHLWPALHF